MGSILMELSKQQRLLQMMEERGFALCQQNGQRTYGGPPPNWGMRPVPTRDSEVFIGRIPRMCFEDELIPLFLTAGELYEFRLMLDFSGTNRGYGYAHYATVEGAMKAIQTLNKFEIRPGHHIGVLKSKNNCRLLFGNIKASVTREEFSNFIQSATAQVLNVFIFSNFEQLKTTDYNISSEVEEAFLERMPRTGAACQFAIVEYENHKAAAVARRVLIPKYGHVLTIDWAIPPKERRPRSQSEHTDAPLLQNSAANKMVPASYSLKSRPVPVLVTPPPKLKNLPTVFVHVTKYFKLLIKLNLHSCIAKGEIPFNIYSDIETKIIERIKSLENCGQAVQLIFNYLSWFNDKKNLIIDLETQKVLYEVKLYSDNIYYFVFHRASGKPADDEKEGYFCDILPVQLVYLYRLALFMPLQDRNKVCGRLSSSLKLLDEMLYRARTGDKKIQQLFLWIMRIDLDTDEGILNKVDLRTTNKESMWKPLENLNPVWTSSPAFRKEIDLFNVKKMNPDNFLMNCQNNSLPSMVIAPLPDIGKTFPARPILSAVETPEMIKIGPNIFDAPAPPMLAPPSPSEPPQCFPNSFKNVPKYFALVMKTNLQKSMDKGEIPIQLANSIETKILNQITDMESCQKAMESILMSFSWECNRIPDGDFSRAFNDLLLYTSTFMDYIHKKTADNNFCVFLSYRFSFLYNVSLLLTGQDRYKLSECVTDAILWLTELIHKIKCGDIDINEFFDKLVGNLLERGDLKDPYFVETIVTEAFNDYTLIMSQDVKINAY